MVRLVHFWSPPTVAGYIDNYKELGECVGFDPKHRIAKVCKLRIPRIIDARCAGRHFELSNAFPGCGTNDPGELAACPDQATKC
jgi:hypothetical protein